MRESPASGSRARPIRLGAFSLVEVVLAMGIISIGLLVMVGLLPQGLKFNHNSLEESQAVNLIQALVADRQSAGYATNSPIYNLPAVSGVTNQLSGTIYVTEDFAVTNAQPSGARYRVTYTVYPATTQYADATNYPATGPLRPVSINFKVSWPAPVSNFPSSVETITTFMQP